MGKNCVYYLGQNGIAGEGEYAMAFTVANPSYLLIGP